MTCPSQFLSTSNNKRQPRSSPSVATPRHLSQSSTNTATSPQFLAAAPCRHFLTATFTSLPLLQSAWCLSCRASDYGEGLGLRWLRACCNKMTSQKKLFEQMLRDEQTSPFLLNDWGRVKYMFNVFLGRVMSPSVVFDLSSPGRHVIRFPGSPSEFKISVCSGSQLGLVG